MHAAQTIDVKPTVF